MFHHAYGAKSRCPRLSNRRQSEALNTSNRVICWFNFSFRSASQWISSWRRYRQEKAILTQHPGCLVMKSVIRSQQLLHGENETYISTRVAVRSSPFSSSSIRWIANSSACFPLRPNFTKLTSFLWPELRNLNLTTHKMTHFLMKYSLPCLRNNFPYLSNVVRYIINRNKSNLTSEFHVMKGLRL